MTIISSAPNGIQVETSAKDSAGNATALGSQSTALPTEIIMPEAITANNENDLEASPVYIGRLIRIRDNATGVATVVIAAGGTGHAVDDILPLSGGTAQRQARIRVTAISGSAITAVEIESEALGSTELAVGEDVGEYSVEPSNPVSQGTAIVGSGTGATFTVTFKNVEENRYCTGDVSNTLTVHEPWIDGPIGATNPHNYRVVYIIQDLATVNGIGLLNFRVNDYSASRFIRLTNAGVNGGWFAILDGASLQTDNNNSSIQASFDVEGGGEFWNGYLAGGIPVGGGYMIGTTGDGDLQFSLLGGGKAKLYDWFGTNVNSCGFDSDGILEIREAKLFAFTLSSTFFANVGLPTSFVTIRNLRMVEDDGDADIRFLGGSNVDVDGLFFVGGGLTDQGTGTETLEMKNVGWSGGNIKNGDFITNEVRVAINNNKTWNITNPKWGLIGLTPDNNLDLTTEDNIIIISTTGKLNERYSVDLLLTQTDGTVIANGKLYVVEALTNKTISVEIETDTTGKASDDLTVLTISGQKDAGTAGTGPIAVTGLDFNDNSPSPDTIVRSDGGSFITDGWEDIDAIVVTLSTADNGNFRIATGGVAASTLTLQESGVLSDTQDDTAAVLDSLERPAFTRFGDFAVRVYKYTFEPFIGSQVFDTFLFGGTREGEGGFKPSISLPVDPAITESNQATAISNGSGVEIGHQLTLPYDGQTGNFALGLVVTGGTSGAQGTIIADTDGGASGTLVLELVEGRFEDDEALTDSATGVAVVNSASGGTNLSYKVFHYDGGTGTNPTVGETITVTNGGADTTGELTSFEGDATEGILILENWNGVEPDNNGAITGDTSSFAADADISGGGSSFNEEYFWMVNGNAKTMTVLYDYMMARLSETTLVDPFNDVIIWGEDEVEKVIFSGADGFSTKRTVNLSQGVWIRNRGAGTIELMTSDGGATFIPPVEVTVTFDQMKDNSEVRVFEAGTNIEIAGIEDATAGSPDNRNFAWSAPASVSVDYKIHNWQPGVPVYETIEVTNFTVPTTNQTIIIQQRLDRNAA